MPCLLNSNKVCMGIPRGWSKRQLARQVWASLRRHFIHKGFCFFFLPSLEVMDRS